jgi:hypothetical protein
MERLLDSVAVLSGALIVLVLGSLRRAHIRVEYSVSWLAAGVVMLAISQHRPLLDRLAALLGAGEPAAALLVVALSVFLLVFYRFSVIISRLRDNNIALAQKVAILEFRLESLDEERQTAGRN